MRIEDLRVFVAVVETGTVTEVSDALHIAQPSLSRQIHRLQTELGEPLFRKFRRRLILTAFGQAAYEQAREILSKVQTLAELQSVQRLRIGASLTTLAQFVPLAVKQYRMYFPETEVHVETGLSQDIYDYISLGQVEIGVVSAIIQKPLVKIIPLFTDPLWVIAPPGQYFTNEPIVTVEMIANVPLITMDKHTILRADLDALFHSHHVQPDIRMEVNSVEVIQKMVEIGFGVSVLPRSVCLNPGSPPRWTSHKLLDGDISTKEGDRNFGLITHCNDLTSSEKAFVDICREAAAQFNSDVYLDTKA